eukprot:TRINITY_DN30669_c0_g1_i1.p1 TRINITY_DN30669_c0_g1~~TRINITY_DN30669_c0_g1_i1.p1  ORF type:complete len:196 (+),score=11.87 TRINITY_DN30669_c0_g1_i1:154-741(+)
MGRRGQAAVLETSKLLLVAFVVFFPPHAGVAAAEAVATGELWHCRDSAFHGCRGFNLTMSIQPQSALGFAYVDEVRVHKAGCDPIVLQAPYCVLPIANFCPSVLKTTISVNFAEYRFQPRKRAGLLLDGTYVCPGSGSIYRTTVEWTEDLTPSTKQEACTIPKNFGRPAVLTFGEAADVGYAPFCREIDANTIQV